MKILVTGSSGHLGEALMRTLRSSPHDPLGIDILPSPFTNRVGSVSDRGFVRSCMAGAEAVIHTATLHKPHVATHSRQEFIDTNVSGTLNLLEEAVQAGVRAFVFTSTTSVFGDALNPGGGEPAAWITEEVVPRPKNIYGVTKTAAEDLCQLFYRNHRLPALILRTSRFFPEDDDQKAVRDAFSSENAKANELLYRRVDTLDVVRAHLLALEKAAEIGFGKYIISATSPFTQGDLALLHHDAPAVVKRLFPAYTGLYAEKGWRMFPEIDRVYVNAKARRELGWQPEYDFAHVLRALTSGEPLSSELARMIGRKGYHSGRFGDGVYPVENT